MYHSECNMQSLTHKNRNRLIHECKDLNHEIYNTTHKRIEINKNKRGTTQKYGRTNRTKTTHTYVYIYIYPPTPAFAKAGAAPGTTGGVELGSRVASKGARHQGNTSVSYMPQRSTCSCRTLTPTCPCHLFFRTFKTAVCPASNPPNASAGLQGNNSYSYYMPLPSVFQGVQDCRLPALKPPKRFQPSRRPPRQQLLQLHAPAICFLGGSRLPFARPQTPQTLPQASKATTFTATCPCHLFFRGFKTAVCPASNPPNASAGLQGNNSYSYMPLPSVF